MPELNIYKNKEEVLRIPLSAKGIRIGRALDCDIILPHESISRYQARIDYNQGSFVLVNLSETSATKVGSQLVKTHTLVDRDEIYIGDYRIVFSQQGEMDQQRDLSVATCIGDISSEPTRILGIKGDQVHVEKFKGRVTQNQKSIGEFDLSSLPFKIGTASDNDLVLKDDYVSSRHAEIIKDPQGYLLRDCASTNGLYLNGRKVSEVILQSGDEIGLGQTKIEILAKRTEEKIKPLNQSYFCGMVGQSLLLQVLFSKLKKVAPTDLTVLIQAESGCGKELTARAIHDLSAVSKGPYVIVNCGAISRELIESELFGHEKGAFTGALNRRIGAFEQAHNGTLFLDEIGELPLELQPKLLRVLENKTIRRVGGETEQKVNVRVVAATHRDLGQRVADGAFREDLYYRLNVISLGIPPLRQRLEDMELLCSHLLRLSDPQGLKKLSRQALEKLKTHDWPGNVRELRNVLLRALVFSEGEIGADDLEFSSSNKRQLSTSSSAVDLNMVEKQKIKEALELSGGHRKKAADLLGIARSTLFKKLKEHDLES